MWNETNFYRSPNDPKMRQLQRVSRYSQDSSNETQRECLDEIIQQSYLSTSGYYDNQKNSFTSSTISNGFNQSDKENKSITNQPNSWKQEKSGDWKYEKEELWQTIEQSLNDKTSTQEEAINSDIKYRHLYSIPNYNKIHFGDLSDSEITDDCDFKDPNVLTINKKPKTLLFNIREYLANYQESNGIPRTEYPFTDLVKVMGQATGRSLIALLYVIINTAPIVEIFLYILRFILDKLIYIKNTNDIRQMMIKYVILGIQLLSIYVCLTFIFGLIVLPIVYMVLHIVAKILSYNY
ncbi:uncharacterized protein V1477_007859 [Vespula maculifrons]|uniref:Uncharacterized protein n=1 Tax=Vespula maculifrons TaxID=7453 RepID=A0ABD2CFY0_VESMC